jgi:pimeloyl-ACP methyl ester carboxylesterase
MHTFGKALIRVAMTLSLWTSSALSAEQPNKEAAAKGLEGMWQGTLKAGVIELRLVIHASRKSDGTYKGTFDSPDEALKGLALDEVSLKDKAVRFEFKKSRWVYEGTIKDDGTEISGDFKQGGAAFPMVWKRTDKELTIRRPQEPKRPYPYVDQDVVYENKKAGIKLAGTLTLPQGKGPFPAALLITGSGPQDRDETLLGHKPFLVLADYLTRRGIAVLRVDDRGVARSTGNFATATTGDFADDVEAGVDFLKQRPEIDPRQIGLIGHSEGGIIAPMVAARSKDIAFIVMLAGTGLIGEEILYSQAQAILKAMGATPEMLARQKAVQHAILEGAKREKDNKVAEKKIHEALDQIFSKLSEDERKQVEKSKGALDGQIKRVLTPWFRFYLTYDPGLALQKVTCPVLALIGEKDTQVTPKENLESIEKALKAGGNKDYTVKMLPKLNHLFQTCTTGAPAEYGRIEETFALAALETIGDWVVKGTRK